MQPGFKGFDNRRSYWAYLFARLKPGVSIEQARTAINVPYYADHQRRRGAAAEGMSEQTMARFKAKQLALERRARAARARCASEARAPLMLLLGVTGVVLLIACANIANLLLARGAGRAPARWRCGCRSARAAGS